jgi:hypothetical protein
MVQILYTHVCKWKKLNLLRLFSEWGRGDKENDGGDEFSYDIPDIL